MFFLTFNYVVEDKRTDKIFEKQMKVYILINLKAPNEGNRP